MPSKSKALIDPQMDAIVTQIEAGARSPLTRRSWRTSLIQFLTWCKSEGVQMDRNTVLTYRSFLDSRGVAASTINQRMQAVRQLAKIMRFSGSLTSLEYEAIIDVKGATIHGRKIGNWLTREESIQLLNTPDKDSIHGLRNRAILALFLGCGLRRGDIAKLRWNHLQQREGRWVIADLLGKGGRIRTVPVPSQVKARIDAMKDKAFSVTDTFPPKEWPVFFQVLKGKLGRTYPEKPLSEEAIYQIVVECATSAGFPTIKPHDLRRTFARQVHKLKAPIDQIKQTLGHSSVQTTEIYIGSQQDLESAPGDLLDIWRDE